MKRRALSLVAAAAVAGLASQPAQSEPAPCMSDDQILCLLGGRLRVEVAWVNQHDGGTAGAGHVVPITFETGAFWFFDPSNLEVFVKVLDGGRVNGHLWVGVASLSDLEFTVRVSDMALGQVNEYHNPPGNLWGVFDTVAFKDDLVDEGDACGGLVAPGTPFQCRQGLFCESPDGTCAQQVDGRGICTAVPDTCGREPDPVCGCDNVTYANDCLRQMAGVSQKHRGECGTTGVVCEPELGLSCGDRQFCDRPVGACTGRGVCLDVGSPVCVEIYDPVCGCNGQTYSNDCFRVAAGVSKQFDGECEPPPQFCGGIAGFACDPGLVCQFPAGMCQVADLAGTCVEGGDACPAVYAPVCGCDGKTYGNDCELLLAGVNKDRDGTCE